MDKFTQLVLTLVRDMSLAGYWVAFLAALVETILLAGLLLPGSTFLLLMGVVAGQGHLDLGDLLFFAIAGATLGDNVNYQLGAKYGQRWLSQGIWFLKAEHMHKAQEFFSHHGGKSVFLGRFVPSVKELMPFIAGMARMNRGPFMLWNLLGAIGWAVQWILPGYLFSQSLSLAHVWLSRIGLLIVLLIALLLIAYALRWAVFRSGPSGFRFAFSILRTLATGFRQRPAVMAWSRRHPRLVAFLRQRVDTSRFQGLPLTLVGLTMGYVVLLFGGLVEDLLMQEAVVTADVRLDSLLASLRTPALTRLFYGITLLGDWLLVMTGILVALLVLWRLRLYRMMVPLLVAVVSAQTLTLLGKFAFHRPHPPLGLLETAGAAFPSGHASASVAFYGFLCFMLFHFARRWRSRVNWVFVAVLVALSIGFSRLYLGAHYLSDVLAGYLVGGLGLLLGMALAYAGWGVVPTRPQPAKGGTLLPSSLAALALAGWLGLFVSANLRVPSSLTAPPAQVTGTVMRDPVQLFSAAGNTQAVTILGERRAPINLVFLASKAQLNACLHAAGWHQPNPISWRTVLRAYWDLAMHQGNAAAPLSPWFWQDKPQTAQWVQPDAKTAVFDRHYLRIWQTPYRTPEGLSIFVATSGHERLPRYHLVPVSDPDFAASQARLLEQLGAVASVSGVQTTPAVSGSQGQAYPAGVSVVTLAACHS